jgi:hypothetical protein
VYNGDSFEVKEEELKRKEAKMTDSRFQND